MVLNTCITSDSDNYAIITETTDGEQYLPEGSSLTAKNRFEYLDTASLDVFKLNATTGITYTSPVIVDRRNYEDPKIELTKDGWFTSIHIVVPNESWIYRELSKQGSIIHTYDIVYFIEDNTLYIYRDGAIERTTLETILAETSTNTTISRVDNDYVSISLLENKYIELYSSIFSSYMYNGGCDLDTCEAERLTAALNLIRHYVRWGQLAEAERIIEKVNFFSGTDKIKSKKETKDCGCL